MRVITYFCFSFFFSVSFFLFSFCCFALLCFGFVFMFCNNVIVYHSDHFLFVFGLCACNVPCHTCIYLGSGSSVSSTGVLDIKDHCNKTVEIYEEISAPELTHLNRHRPLLCTYRFRSFRGAPRDWVLRIRFKKFKVGNILNATHCDGGYLQVREKEEIYFAHFRRRIGSEYRVAIPRHDHRELSVLRTKQ